jgi:exonuclease III
MESKGRTMMQRGRETNTYMEKMQGIQDTEIQEEKLLVMQMNCGSVLANLHEIRLRIELVQPDIVLVQETRLQPKIVPKFYGYHAIRYDRVTPRQESSRDKNLGGGVMTLIKTTNPLLGFSTLPEIKMKTKQLRW